jgi:hypothetical protein
MERGLQEVLDAIQRPSRQAQLDVILNLIERLRPDAIDCHEVLAALAGSLKKNSKYLNPTEVLVSLTLSQRALIRLDEGNEVDGYEELCALEAFKQREAKRGN